MDKLDEEQDSCSEICVFIKQLVDEVIDGSTKNYTLLYSSTDELDEEQDSCSEICVFIKQLVDEVIDESTKNSTASCEEYTRDKRFLERKNEQNGFYYVDDLMQKWNKLPRLKNWHYEINHIDEICCATLKYHAFQIKWAKPMDGYTHPILVVNVYLFLKIRQIYGGCSVEMSYNFEGNRFVHDAQSPFNPKWLINAYNDKKNVIATSSL